MDQYYTTGEFARMAHVTIRTIRYYDKKGLLKPSFINESGYRMYSDEDFLKLQKILSLKYLGFSLNEIGNMTIHDTSADILKSLKMQIGLVHKKMENLEQMEKALQNTTQILETACRWAARSRGPAGPRPVSARCCCSRPPGRGRPR